MAEPRKRQSARWENLSRGLYRFRSNRLSMLGLIMLIFVFLVAIFAPVIAPFPEDATGKTHVCWRDCCRQAQSMSLARTRSGAISSAVLSLALAWHCKLVW